VRQQSAEEAPLRDDELVSGAGTARDSMTVALWTAVGRATGMVRVVVIGAVLGPTFFGNSYQLTNVVPNLVFYGFLAGSLLSSLLVPALVRHIDAGDTRMTGRISGGFLGVEFVALLVAGPLAVLLVPLLVSVFAPAGDTGQQVGQVRLLLVLAVPQVFMYGVVASATAVMYARRRFVLAAAAPAVENLGVIAVLLAAAWRYGTDYADSGSVPMGAVVLLGLGSTGAVILHALIQWVGARRCGVRIVPLPGWRDPEVRVIIRRATHSMAQSGLLALQVLVLLTVAAHVAGGTVAMQISLNFYRLPLALAAAPVGLALLPRLSRLRGNHQTEEFARAYQRALALALFLMAPAAVGYVVLAGPLASSISAGQLDSGLGVTMIEHSLAALSLGLVGETLFVISTQAAYARGDARMPLRSMMVQTGVCLGLLVPALFVGGSTALMGLGGAFAVASWVGGLHLVSRVRRSTGHASEPLWPSVARICGATVVMALVVRVTATSMVAHIDGRLGSLLAVVAGSLVGLITYAALHRLVRSPELVWLVEGARGAGPGRDDSEVGVA
jgi:putative peptidoglycan lipid II flippase